MKSMQITEENDPKIQVGERYQAVVPKTTDPENNTPFRKNDRMVWNPYILPEDIVREYLRDIGSTNADSEERGLFLLHMCSYNVKEALRRHSYMPSVPVYDCSWSNYERECFERGVQKYGKDFHSIQKILRSKSVQDLVEFYYTWKIEKMRPTSIEPEHVQPQF